MVKLTVSVRSVYHTGYSFTDTVKPVYYGHPRETGHYRQVDFLDRFYNTCFFSIKGDCIVDHYRQVAIVERWLLRLV